MGARISENEKLVIMEGLKKGLSYGEIGQQIGRGPTVIGNTARAYGWERNTTPNNGKLWTADEEEYLLNQYNKMAYSAIGKKLGRTESAVRTKLFKLGCVVTDILDEQGYTMAYVAKALNVNPKVVKTWMSKYDLPHAKVKRGKNSFYLIDGVDFWKWAEDHSDLINFRYLEEYAILPQPAWAHKLRFEAVLEEVRQCS